MIGISLNIKLNLERTCILTELTFMIHEYKNVLFWIHQESAQYHKILGTEQTKPNPWKVSQSIASFAFLLSSAAETLALIMTAVKQHVCIQRSVLLVSYWYDSLSYLWTQGPDLGQTIQRKTNHSSLALLSPLCLLYPSGVFQN